MIYCTCQGWPREGYGVREDGMQVHAKCWLPRRMYLEIAVEQDPEVASMLNLFRFGDHHHELYETRELLDNPRYGWCAGYRWTSEVVYGSESGRPARVWVHKDHVLETK